MLEANDMVEAKMAEIRERKMYEMKRMFASSMSEALGGLSVKEIEARKKAGYVKASAPKEKGGLGLSSYDLGQEEKKKRLAGRLKKKVAEETIDEMRAPGEVPGSAERKQDAEKLRTMRKGLGMLDVGRRTLNKDYLAARKAQMKPADKDTSKSVAPEVKLAPDQVKSSQTAQTTQDTEDKFGKLKPIPLKKDPRRRTIDRYRKSLERFKTLKAKGSKTASARQSKINRGYAGIVAKDLAKRAIKGFAKGTVAAGQRFMDSPIMSDLHSIGTRNL